jgi:hypothetical protein
MQMAGLPSPNQFGNVVTIEQMLGVPAIVLDGVRPSSPS